MPSLNGEIVKVGSNERIRLGDRVVQGVDVHAEDREPIRSVRVRQAFGG